MDGAVASLTRCGDNRGHVVADPRHLEEEVRLKMRGRLMESPLGCLRKRWDRVLVLGHGAIDLHETAGRDSLLDRSRTAARGVAAANASQTSLQGSMGAHA